MITRLLLPLIAAALLAGCETTPGAGSAQQGYAHGTSGSGTSTYPRKYVNKAYGNCGHCMGNTGR